mmetsp:Transcript_35373/g.112635  ORF Transcript_35373/g.112635 Transcript_35373/m.112635 type:complete len:517 (-) Transcript_35373:111-1661(-)
MPDHHHEHTHPLSTAGSRRKALVSDNVRPCATVGHEHRPPLKRQGPICRAIARTCSFDMSIRSNASQWSHGSKEQRSTAECRPTLRRSAPYPGRVALGPDAAHFFSLSFSLPLPSSGFELSTDWIRGSFGSTPGSEPRTDWRKSASWKTELMSLAGAPAGAAVPWLCDMDMASASCIASSSSPASTISVSSSAGAGTAEGGAEVAGVSGGPPAGAWGVAAGSAAAGVVSPAEGSDIASACSSSAASSIVASAAVGTLALAPSVEASPGAAVASALAPPASSAAFAAAASCRARSSSMETRSAHANSGSIFGSTPRPANSPPPSPPAPPPPTPIPMPAPSSPCTIGDESRMSDSTCGPGGTVTRCELSSELTALSSASSLAAFSASSPKLIMSMATEFFLSFLPSFTSVASSSCTGDPTNTMILCLWFLFCRCLSDSCATWMPAERLARPPILMPCDRERILPTSAVSATCTSTPLPPVDSRPTTFSGLDCVLAPESRFTASSCASMRDGAWSPLRI